MVYSIIVKTSFLKNPLLWIAILLSLVVGRTLLTTKHFHTHDDIQVMRIADYAMCWEDGQIPCRWSKNLGKGYGYPLFIFYPPIIYFVPLLISKLGLSYIASLNIFMFMTLPIAAYGMFKLVHALTRERKLAFLGSVLYTFYPYHAQNIFIRGVLAENLAWSLLPFIFWQFYELIANNKKSYNPAILLTLIILTHNISSMIFLPITIFWCILLLLSIRKKSKRLKSTLALTIKNLLLPFFLSAFFLIPALVERTIVQSDSMIINYYSYLVHFVSVNQILFSNFWGYGGSGPDLLDGMAFMIGKAYWIAFALLAAHYLYTNRSERSQLLKPVFVVSIILAPIFTFMMHARSTPIWLLLEPLQYIQFPWRFLGVVGFFIVLFITYTAKYLPKNIKNSFIFLLAMVVIISNFSYFKPEKYDAYIDDDYITGQLSNEQKETHLYDYMPITVHRIPDRVADSPIYESEQNITDISDIKWRSNFTEVTITQEADNLITFSSIEYPHWQAYVDGTPVSHQVDSVTGFVEVHVSSGTHTVKITRIEPSYRKLGNIISIASLIYVLFLIRSSRNKKI